MWNPACNAVDLKKNQWKEVIYDIRVTKEKRCQGLYALRIESQERQHTTFFAHEPSRLDVKRAMQNFIEREKSW